MRQTGAMTTLHWADGRLMLIAFHQQASHLLNLDHVQIETQPLSVVPRLNLLLQEFLLLKRRVKIQMEVLA
jgi:hypothetical protein